MQSGKRGRDQGRNGNVHNPRTRATPVWGDTVAGLDGCPHATDRVTSPRLATACRSCPNYNGPAGFRMKRMKKCKSCKADIDSKASKCSHCGTDQRNFFARHKIMTGILVIIIFFGFIAIVSGGKNSGSATSNSSSGSSNTPAVQTAKVADTVNDGDLAFTVQSMDTAQTVGDSYSQKTAQGQYVILTVKIQNNGKDTKTINASDFNIVDNQGRKYDYSTDGQTAMEMSNGGTSFFLQQVQPTLSVTGKIIFDVP